MDAGNRNAQKPGLTWLKTTAPIAPPATTLPALPAELWLRVLALSDFDRGDGPEQRANIHSVSRVNRTWAHLAPVAYPNYHARMGANMAAAALSMPYMPHAPCAVLPSYVQVALSKVSTLHIARPVRGYPNNDGEVGNWLIEASRPYVRKLEVADLWGGPRRLQTIHCFARPFARLRVLSFAPMSDFCGPFAAHYKPENYPALIELNLCVGAADIFAAQGFALQSPTVQNLTIEEDFLLEYKISSLPKTPLHWPQLETLGLQTGGASIFASFVLVAPRLHTLTVRDPGGEFFVLAHIDWATLPSLKRLVLLDSPYHAMDADDVVRAVSPAMDHVAELDLCGLHLPGGQRAQLSERMTGRFESLWLPAHV